MKRNVTLQWKRYWVARWLFQKIEHFIRIYMGENNVAFEHLITQNLGIKSIRWLLNSPQMYFFVLWGISSRIGLFCHHCNFFHKDVVQAKHSVWERLLLGGGLRPKKSIQSAIFSARVKALCPLHHKTCLVSENHRTLRWKWAFSGIDSKVACDGVLSQDRWRALGLKANLSQPRDVGAIYVQSLPHPY